MMKVLNAYVKTCLAYGCAHKYAILWDGQVESKGKMRNMLMGEKIGAFTLGMGYSVLLAPVWLIWDLNKLDLYMQGLRAEDVGYEDEKRNFSDYVYR